MGIVKDDHYEQFKEISPRQLWAVVKMVLLEQPGMSDAEWKARCLQKLGKWKFFEPADDRLARAMASVEHDLRQTLGTRPVIAAATDSTPFTVPSPPSTGDKRSRKPAGWDVVTALMSELRGRVSRPSLEAPAEPRDTLPLEEVEVLNAFWERCKDESADRVELLRALAEIAIVRPDDWDYAGIRAGAGNHNLKAYFCFACRNADTKWAWHHVIQIQFGGSNYIRNRVALCERCHSQVHPWLPEVPRSIDDWSSLADIAPAALAKAKEDIA